MKNVYIIIMCIFKLNIHFQLTGFACGFFTYSKLRYFLKEIKDNFEETYKINI